MAYKFGIKKKVNKTKYNFGIDKSKNKSEEDLNKAFQERANQENRESLKKMGMNPDIADQIGPVNPLKTINLEGGYQAKAESYYGKDQMKSKRPTFSQEDYESMAQKDNVKRKNLFGTLKTEVDHLAPISLGGTNEPQNLKTVKAKTGFLGLFKSKTPAEEMPEANRQGGTLEMEKKIIDAYNNGQLTQPQSLLLIKQLKDVRDNPKEVNKQALKLAAEETKQKTLKVLGDIMRPFDFLARTGLQTVVGAAMPIQGLVVSASKKLGDKNLKNVSYDDIWKNELDNYVDTALRIGAPTEAFKKEPKPNDLIKPWVEQSLQKYKEAQAQINAGDEKGAEKSVEAVSEIAFYKFQEMLANPFYLFSVKGIYRDSFKYIPKEKTISSIEINPAKKEFLWKKQDGTTVKYTPETPAPVESIGGKVKPIKVKPSKTVYQINSEPTPVTIDMTSGKPKLVKSPNIKMYKTVMKDGTVKIRFTNSGGPILDENLVAKYVQQTKDTASPSMIGQPSGTIVDQATLDPKSIQRMYSDVVGRKELFSPKSIKEISNLPTAVDSPGKFYENVANVLKKNNEWNAITQKELARTFSDFAMKENQAIDFYGQAIGSKVNYVPTVEGQLESSAVATAIPPSSKLVSALAPEYVRANSTILKPGGIKINTPLTIEQPKLADNVETQTNDTLITKKLSDDDYQIKIEKTPTNQYSENQVRIFNIINDNNPKLIEEYKNFRKDAQKDMVEFEKKFFKLQKKSNLDMLKPSPKSDGRSIEKAFYDYIVKEGERIADIKWGEIKDINRGALIVDNVKDILPVIRDIKGHFVIQKIKNRLDPTIDFEQTNARGVKKVRGEKITEYIKNDGYKDVLIHVKLSNGTYAEIQIVPRDIQTIKDTHHVKYEVTRVVVGEGKIKQLDNIERQRLLKETLEMRKLYDAAWKKYESQYKNLKRAFLNINNPKAVENRLKVHAKDIIKIYNNIKDNGGITYNIVSGKDLGGTNAFSVSIYPERGIKIDVNSFKVRDIYDFLKKNIDLLKDGNNSFGAWKDDNFIYLDAVVTPKEIVAAKQLGKTFNQIAAFDLNKFEEVPTGGTGEDIGQFGDLYKRRLDVKQGKLIEQDKELAKTLKEAKGLSAEDIIQKYPDINLKKEVVEGRAPEIKPASGRTPVIEKPKPIEKPVEKPVEVRPKEEVKTETPEITQFKSRVYERLQNEIPEEFREDLIVNRINQEKSLNDAIDLVAKDKNEAYQIAMGSKQAPEGQTATMINIVLQEKALDEGNFKLYSQLIKNRSLAQTKRGQELVAEKASVTNNSTSRYVKELISIRLDRLGNK
jgi:hypothetical protein